MSATCFYVYVCLSPLPSPSPSLPSPPLTCLPPPFCFRYTPGAEGSCTPHVCQASKQATNQPINQLAAHTCTCTCRYEACKADAATLCKDVKFGAGRVQACLVSDVMVVYCTLSCSSLIGWW